MGFVGVSTAGSSINKVFPRWGELLGLPSRRLVGHDLPLEATRDQYRALVQTIKGDPTHAGALVTTHKISLYEAAADLFDEVDDLARTFGEVSSIFKRDGRLHGAAKDPVTVALALKEFLPEGHFAATGGEVLCLGAGGAGCALTFHLATRHDRPAVITCTDVSQERLDHLREIHMRGNLDPAAFRYVRVASSPDGGALTAGLPPASLVVNATGMGKDRPGSPLSDDVVFPDRGLAWDFNYRGRLDFLAQARRQEQHRDLVVVDGWRYFVHGWTSVVADVFGLHLDEATVERLAVAAESER